MPPHSKAGQTVSTVIFEFRGYQFSCRFRYDPDIVDLVKTSVPGSARSWDPSTKQWLVDADWVRPLADTLRHCGHTVIGLDPPKPPPTNSHANSHNDHDWALGVFKRIGPNRSDAAYRLLSRLVHPDVGGSDAMMQELNAARREIEKGGQ